MNFDGEEPDSEVQAEKSKTQIKKEMLALQTLGEKLVDLSAQQRDHIPMDEKLRRAVEEAKAIKSRSARKRHMQYIGKLMRAADSDVIAKAYNDVIAENHRSVRQHHLIERWRDTLIRDDAAFGQFVAQHPHVDRQQLHQLTREARRETEFEGKAPSATRKLFRLIRETLDSD